jgi:hypothetical protein
MTTPTPERFFDVQSYDIAIAHQGGEGAIGLRFHLRDRSTLNFALPPDIATGLMLELQKQLRVLADEPPPTGH